MIVMEKRRQILGLLGWIALSVAVGALGALASMNAGQFYTALERPSWAPPASVFGPVWSILYLMMAFAVWRVWRKTGYCQPRTAIRLYVLQLIVNALWSWLFFAWHLGALSFADIVLLWMLVVTTIYAFWHIDKWAALLMVPYLAWVTFAAALNYTVWQMNPAILG